MKLKLWPTCTFQVLLCRVILLFFLSILVTQPNCPEPATRGSFLATFSTATEQVSAKNFKLKSYIIDEITFSSICLDQVNAEGLKILSTAV